MLRSILTTISLLFASSTVENCDKNSLLELTELALTPDPPIKGSPVKMTVKFNNPNAIVEDGTITTFLNINGFPYPSQTEPLCENVACPITSGNNDRSVVFTWPQGVSGKITSKIIWEDKDGNSLLCVQISTTPVQTVKKYLRTAKYAVVEFTEPDEL